MTTQTAAPARTPREQIQQAVGDPPSSDYVFDVRTAIGWTIVTFGLYAFYVLYQLMRRARDHNRRRVALLLAAQELARQRAIETGRPEALDQALERVQAEVQALRALDDDFRDPMLWLLGSFLGSGLVWLAEAILLDQDLTRHERHERAAEAELTRVFAELGFSLPASVPVMKQPHNCVRRVVALVATLGLYSLWWAADLMREGNAHLQQDQAWEDALAAVAVDAAPVPVPVPENTAPVPDGLLSERS